MSYIKQNFESGQKLKASQLNAMDDQIALNEENIEQLSEQIAGKQDTLTFDSTPTSGSNNPVISGGLFTKFEEQNEGIETAILSASNAMPGSLKWNGVIGDREYVALMENESVLMTLVHVSDEPLCQFVYMFGGGELGVTVSIQEMGDLFFKKGDD